MKKTIFVLLAALVTINISVLAEDLPTYYADLDGKSAKTLVDALTTVARKNYSGRSYKQLWTDFCTTDAYPADSTDKAGKLWDMYSNVVWTCGNKQCGNYTEVGSCYNREHSLPKSWFGVSNNPPVGPGTDLFHMYPTDGYVNNQRSNYAFGECSGGTTLVNGSNKGKGRLGTSTFEGYTSVGTVFEPNDEFKGDFARTYFYMVLAWCNFNKSTYSFTQEAAGAKMFNDDFTASGHFGLTDYSVALLMKWHRQDPVSRKETDRNNAVQSIQGNRNPFIDYPDLAEYLWGSHAGEVFHIGGGGGCTKLATPSVAAVAGDKQVTLTWAVVDGAKNYTVTISNGVGFTTECLTDAVIGTVTISGGVCTCVITGLTNGLTYTTSVKANADDTTCDSDVDQDQVTPQAAPTPVTYQIRFLNGTTVLQDENLAVGVLPEYKGATPTKPADTQYTYTFSNWSPDIEVVTKSQDYLAQFNATPIDPSAINNVAAEYENVRKVMINGLLFIQRGEHIYDVTGRLVK